MSVNYFEIRGNFSISIKLLLIYTTDVRKQKQILSNTSLAEFVGKKNTFHCYTKTFFFIIARVRS